MKKKLLICALLSATAVSVAAVAGCGIFGGGNNDDGKTVEQDKMRFELKADGTYELAKFTVDLESADGIYNGDGETVSVPDAVKGKAVTSVAEYAFAYTGVKEVTVPNTVSVLPDRVFEGCVYLETVNIPAVTSVGKSAFYGCEKLESIEFAHGLTEIGDRAFTDCPALSTVVLPDTVVSLGENCFRGCPIESINANGVQTLGENAFYGCAQLAALSLPNVKSIGDDAMRDCTSLAALTIGNRLETYNDALYGCSSLTKVSINSPVPEEMFQWNETVTELTLGEGVTSIGEMAFGYIKGVKTVTLPSTLEEIGEGAFWESSLTEITIPSSVKTVGESAFYGNSALASVTVAAGVKNIGDKAFSDCNSLTSITLGEGVESIGAQAFSISGAETLEIVLPSTVKTVGDGCFAYGSTGITANKIIINDTVETVGENILKGCKVRELAAPASYGHNAGATLEKLTIFGEGDIPVNAYKHCVNLKTVSLGAGVKRIGNDAFKALETINLDGIESMGTGALGDLSTLTCLTTENGVKTLDGWVITSDYSQGGAGVLDLSGYTGIYHNAFEKTEANDTSALTTVMLVGSDNTSNLKFIGRRAFNGAGITAVEVPASVAVWDYAFYGCESLNTVSISHGVAKIADYAFANCTGLDGVNLSATDVTEIGDSSFSGCSQLRLVTLADGVKKIGNNAFTSCTALSFIDLKGAEEIGEYAFFRCTQLTSVTMDVVKTIAENAFNSCSALTEYDLTASVTQIGYSALGCAQTINYAGTKEQWDAVVKGTERFPNIWHSRNDLTVNFSDGTSHTYQQTN